jgi:hypothetical protein
MVTSTAACSAVLGLDSGAAEVDAGPGDDSGEAPPVPDGAADDDGARVAVPDAADSGSTLDADARPDPSDGGPGDVRLGQDAIADPDAAPRPDAACRAPLQACAVGTDCCSGVCGLNLECL